MRSFADEVRSAPPHIHDIFDAPQEERVAEPPSRKRRQMDSFLEEMKRYVHSTDPFP
jgi:hypothetical protein